MISRDAYLKNFFHRLILLQFYQGFATVAYPSNINIIIIIIILAHNMQGRGFGRIRIM